jgi:hypothetical protein
MTRPTKTAALVWMADRGSACVHAQTGGWHDTLLRSMNIGGSIYLTVGGSGLPNGPRISCGDVPDWTLSNVP